MLRWTRWWQNLSAILNRAIRATSLLLILFYRSTLSVWFGGACRFEPSCSCYAEEAFTKHPPLTALYLTFRRILKCHPFGPFGLDPVPELRGTLEKR